MSDTGGALRATSDALVGNLDRLVELEDLKRALAPGDPRLVALAQEIEALAERVMAGTTRQLALAEKADELGAIGAPHAPNRSIEATPREIHVILAEWRDAERRADEAAPGSQETTSAAADAARLRDEYRQAQDARSRGG